MITAIPTKPRNHSIDLLKFIAALLITNSHMSALYPGKFKAMATGGAVGDALFFFASGLLLMMGANSDFFNWYKRRVNRIFPTIFAVALISIVVFGEDPSLKHVILKGGGWFVQAIFLFYALFWFVKRFLSDKMWIAYLLDAIVILIWFILFWDKEESILTVTSYLRWPCFFMMMLLGGSVYKSTQDGTKEKKEYSLWLYLVLLVALLLLFYGYQGLEGRLPILKEFQVVILLPLIGIILTIYKICSHPKVIHVYMNRHFHMPLYYISACCLEIYLCQWWCMGVGTRLIKLFPLNVIVTFLLIFVVAYLTKVLSNFLSQTFKTERYDWKGMIRL